MCLSEKNHKVISMFVFVTIKSWHRREGRNLFITGTSKNSTVKGDQPNKTLIRDSELQDRERARVRQCVFFLAHNREEEVQGDRGLDQQMHKHTHTNKGSMKKTIRPNTLQTPSPGFDGLTTRTIEAGGWRERVHTQLQMHFFVLYHHLRALTVAWWKN